MRSRQQKILIRCDASPEIGFGHVVRCLALADELRDSYGFTVEFAMLQGPQGAAQAQTQRYRVHHPAEGEKVFNEGHWLQNIIAKNQHQVLILDVRTDLATESVQFIRETRVLIVCIDDPSDRRRHAHLAFYPPVPQVERLDWTDFTGEWFSGWDWVLLRPQFAQEARIPRYTRRPESIEGFPNNHRLPTILITMGGSDPARFTLMALEAVEQLDQEVRVLVTIGSGFVYETELINWLVTAKKRYEIQRDVKDVASLMSEADLAICAFGVTSYELAAVGVPAIYICLTQDHAESASAFVNSGFGVSLGVYGATTPQSLLHRLRCQLINGLTLETGATTTPPKVDGYGTQRIARTIVDHDRLTSDERE